MAKTLQCAPGYQERHFLSVRCSLKGRALLRFIIPGHRDLQDLDLISAFKLKKVSQREKSIFFISVMKAVQKWAPEAAISILKVIIKHTRLQKIDNNNHYHIIIYS